MADPADIITFDEWSYDGQHILECGDIVLHAGRVRDVTELRSMVYAYRQGVTAGEKRGRLLQQIEIANALGVSLSQKDASPDSE